MLVIFTGNGKGKTTAALGQAARAVGQGKRVLMIQFIKSLSWKAGEDFMEIRGKGEFRLEKRGLGFVGILDDNLPKSEHIEAAEKAFDYFKKELASGSWDMIILDEINVAVSLGLLDEEEALGVLKNIPLDKIVILTGRDAPQSFIDKADLVTEMKEVKHPLNKGKLAKEGIEF
ncbi:MAG: cob(I)yrinic acid a,c-diamide adenosyltransferase [Candidatus Colwellbacteria bacterium]|nr:cob(I)yrinic acid a,c-diamide adenosyltransferase [Candidatus Colwellbacteria bacterium]